MFNKIFNGESLFPDEFNDSNSKKIKLIGIISISLIILIIILTIIFPKSKNDIITLTLNGEETLTINQYSNYQELGATASSNQRGNISDDIIIEGNVNTSITGDYKIKYTVRDNKGKEYVIERTIRVVANNNTDNTIASYTISNSIYTADALVINLKILIVNYKYTILPNNLRNYSKNLKYEVKSNGKYTFYIYDNNNTAHKYEVYVSNIDTTEPVVTCKALIANDKTSVTITASDIGSGIASYSYAFNGNYGDYISANKYVYNGISEVVYVRVKDNAGNIKSASCMMENNNSEEEEPTSPVVTGLVPCNNPNRLAQTAVLNQRISSAGKRTRGAVLAAAKYLATDFGYHIPYYFGGGHGLYNEGSLIGINPSWGCPVSNGKVVLDANAKDIKHPYGIDCSGYVAWAFLNAGFTDEEINYYASTQANNKWNGISVEKVSFASGGAKRAEPGDLVWKEGHIGFVIEIDIPKNRIRLAHAAGGGRGLIIEYHNLSNGKSLESDRYFTHVVLMKNFYDKTH